MFFQHFGIVEGTFGHHSVDFKFTGDPTPTPLRMFFLDVYTVRHVDQIIGPVKEIYNHWNGWQESLKIGDQQYRPQSIRKQPKQRDVKVRSQDNHRRVEQLIRDGQDLGGKLPECVARFSVQCGQLFDKVISTFTKLFDGGRLKVSDFGLQSFNFRMGQGKPVFPPQVTIEQPIGRSPFAARHFDII